MFDYLQHITQICERLEASKFDRGLCSRKAFLGKEEKYRAQVPKALGAFRRYFSSVWPTTIPPLRDFMNNPG
jgi:hypothetical protein